MTGETRMSLAVAGRKRETVQTVRRLAECSRKWRLRQETSDGRGWQTVLRDVQLQRERRPQTAYRPTRTTPHGTHEAYVGNERANYVVIQSKDLSEEIAL